MAISNQLKPVNQLHVALLTVKGSAPLRVLPSESLSNRIICLSQLFLRDLVPLCHCETYTIVCKSAI